MREAVGHVWLVGVQTYHQLREVYRALRRVYDAAQTPFQRLAC